MVDAYLLNGEFFAGRNLEVQVDEPFFADGYGLFETLRSIDYKPGFLRAHFERMAQAAGNLGLEFTLSYEDLARDIQKLLAKSGLGDARIRINLLQKRAGQDLLITAAALPPFEKYPEPIAVGAADAAFCGMTALPGVKSLNYMVNRMAWEKGQGLGFGEVLFSNEDDQITEGTRSTIFAVFGDELYTPPLGLQILPGITRRIVMELAGSLGILSYEKGFSFVELAGASEAFLTGSVRGVQAVKSLNGRDLGKAPGPICRQLQDAYAKRVMEP